MNKSVYWCFTLNNYDDSEVEILNNFFNEKCKYAIYGKEKGKMETPHLQGFFVLKKQWRLSALKKINNRWHLESARSDIKDNYKYCSKEGDFYEFGDKRKCGQGARSDIINALDECKNPDEFNEKYPGIYVRYHSGIDKHYFRKQKKKLNSYNPVEVSYIWGESRSGKTSSILKKHGPENCFILDSEDNKLWFDGYENQEVLILDDFRGNIKLTYLLRLLDNYIMRLPVKGGHTISNWKYIYITNNDELLSLYPNVTPRSWEALTNRIKHIIHMS